MIPGIIPAMNSALMDCSVASPYRTKITLGGISMARVPAAATLAVERESAYLNLRISGRAMLPMVAQVAVLEPQTAPNSPGLIVPPPPAPCFGAQNHSPAPWVRSLCATRPRRLGDGSWPAPL